MRYLDQEQEAGEDTVRFQALSASFENYGMPEGVSLRDYDMAVTALRVELGSLADLAALREPGRYPELVVVRGCTIITTLALVELPVWVDGQLIVLTGPYKSTPRDPFPIYLYNPVRQNLSFATRGDLPVPVTLRFWWERLARITVREPRGGS